MTKALAEAGVRRRTDLAGILVVVPVLALVLTLTGSARAVDCNQNGFPDFEDVAAGRSEDCDGNDWPDECDLEPFAPGFRPGVTLRASPAAVADLDADGALDVVGTESDASLTISFGDGTGSFPVELRTRTRSEEVTRVVDLDADPFPDLVIGGESTLRLLRNLGPSIPGDPSSLRFFEIGQLPGRLDPLVADLDADGDADILSLSRSANGWTFTTFLNAGEGGLTSRGTFAANEPVALVDLDGDGLPDLILRERLASSLWAWTYRGGRGDGSFATEARAIATDTSGPYPRSPHFTDLDDDGDIDGVLLRVRGEVTALENRGGEFVAVSLFTPPDDTSSDRLAADFDGDGDVDVLLVESSGGSIFVWNEGDLRFAGERGGVVPDTLRGLIAARLDGDARADLVAHSGLLPEFGVASFVLLGTDTREVIDCDGDGVLDSCQWTDADCDGVLDGCELAAGTAEDRNANGMPDGEEFDCDDNGVPDAVDLALAPERDCNGNAVIDTCEEDDGEEDGIGVDACDPVAPDCNGNGRRDEIDVAVEYALRGEHELADGPEIDWVVAGDFDADGRGDLLLRSAASKSNRLYYGRRDGEALDVQDLGRRQLYDSAVDLDGDGRLDLAVRGRNSLACGRVYVEFLLQVEPRRFVPGPIAALPFGQKALRAAEVDGDGRRDLLVAVTGHGVLLFPRETTGTFGAPFRIAARDGSVEVLDLEGDGDPDLLAIGGSGFEGRLHVNDGRGRFTAGEVLTLGGTSVRVADIDGDGDLDLLSDSGSLGQNDGAGRFVFSAAWESTRSARSLTLADLDGDGDLDAASTEFDWIFLRRNDGDGRFSSWRHMGIGAGPLSASTGIMVAALDHAGSELADLALVARRRGGAGGTLGDILRVYADPALPDGVGRQHFRGLAVNPLAASVSGDFDGDGDPDPALVTSSRFVFLENREGELARFTAMLPPLPAGEPIVSAAFGDFDADGRQDIALVTSTPRLFVFAGRGAFEFVEVAGTALTEPAERLEAIDLDGDGDLDLVAAAFEWGVVRLLENRGAGEWLPAELFLTAPFRPRERWDVEQPVGRAILLPFPARAGRPPAVLVADAAGRLTLVVLAPGGEPEGVALETSGPVTAAARADLAGRGERELIVAVVVSGAGGARTEIVHLREREDLAFEARVLHEEDGLVVSLVADDFDGDGRRDIAGAIASRFAEDELSDDFSDEVFVAFQERTGSFAAQRFAAGGAPVQLLSASLDARAPRELFAIKREVEHETYPSSVAVLRVERRAFSADLDEDGVPDECAAHGYRRGDGNQDGRTDLSDAVATLEALFEQGPVPPCTKALDADDDGRVQLTDAVYVLNFLFLSGRPLPPPFATCGPDPTPDALDCHTAPACGG